MRRAPFYSSSRRGPLVLVTASFHFAWQRHGRSCGSALSSAPCCVPRSLMAEQRFPYEKSTWGQGDEQRRWYEALERATPDIVRGQLARLAPHVGSRGSFSVGTENSITVGFAQDWLAWHDSEKTRRAAVSRRWDMLLESVGPVDRGGSRRVDELVPRLEAAFASTRKPRQWHATRRRPARTRTRRRPLRPGRPPRRWNWSDDMASNNVREKQWREAYIRQMTPSQAADRAASDYSATRPLVDRSGRRKR